MLLIFSDYAAEIWNVPGVTKPALIDLCVRQAKFRHAFITAEVFPFFFWLKCAWRVQVPLQLTHICGQTASRVFSSTHKVREPGEGIQAVCAQVRPLSCPHSLSALPSLLVTECQKPSYWQLPPFLWTYLKSHFLFVLWMAFSVCCLCFLPAHLLTRKI